MAIINGQCSFIDSVKRSLCHVNLYRYRKSIGNPISIKTTAKNIWLRFWSEWAGIGDGV